MARNESGVRIVAPDVPLDTVYDLLKAPRRHRVLWYLENAEGFVLTETLAEYVAAEADADPRRVNTTLVHAHLPKLAAAEVVEYDRSSGAVALAPDVEVQKFSTGDGVGESSAGSGAEESSSSDGKEEPSPGHGTEPTPTDDGTAAQKKRDVGGS